MAFAGISFVSDGRSTQSGSATTTTVTDSAYHLLVVDGYSRTKQDYPNGKCFKSHPFRVAGYRWVIEYYPNGRIGHDTDYMSLFLYMDDDENVTETVKVQFGFTFVDKVQKQPSEIRERKVHGFNNRTVCCGYHRFMKIKDLEKSTHLKDNGLTIKCEITVTKDVNTGATAVPFVVVPESDMHQHFTSFLHSGEGTDVTFEVGGEIFAAHRCILASRSAVFKAEFSGHMDEERYMASVTSMDNMEARVFKLLLDFIYNDSVPETEEEDVTWQHLLVVADGYDLPRLRLMCEQKLCTYINTSSAATVLALAEKHHCQGLKEACLDFLKVHANLQEVMMLDGLDHLTSSCPSVFKELISRLVSPNTEAASNTATLPFAVVPASDMHRHFIGLLKSGEGTDVMFEVSGEMIPAHRCVLAARSPVFRAQLFGPMKEGTTTSVIRIKDMEAKVFKLLLSYIYSDLKPDIEEWYDYEEDASNVDEAEVLWQHLLVAADRYDIQRLRLMCEEKLCGCISTTTVATILELAEQHHCRGLKEACLHFLDFPANLQEVMDAGGLNHLRGSCPSVLIDLIAKLALLKLNN